MGPKVRGDGEVNKEEIIEWGGQPFTPRTSLQPHSGLTWARTGAPWLFIFEVSPFSPSFRLWLCERLLSLTHAHSHRHSFCVKGCSGKQRAEWLSVSGALVMCWWYSFSGMCTRVLPILVLWIPNVGPPLEHICNNLGTTLVCTTQPQQLLIITLTIN